MKIKTFRDLVVWQRGHELVLLTYKLTKDFPKDEQYSLTPQVRRAAISVTPNIAEGFGRFQSKDGEHFYVMAKDSLVELDNHYQIALDLNYLDKESYIQIVDLIDQTGKLLNAFLKTHRSRL
ncbi:MAG TPA: four helix bundle protein [Candidatus Saccharimonadales bacterium]|nr:four helix bundle protein [Candidatus Saccharimonadales bacterium]